MREFIAQMQRRAYAAEHRRLCEARGFPVPPWQSSEERAAVDDFVLDRPFGMTIEHVAPLGHPEIVGMHVRANLAYLSPDDNNAKSNRLPDGLTPAEAVKRGLAIWRKDIGPDGTINWSRYPKETHR
jgi:hypothetical protein